MDRKSFLKQSLSLASGISLGMSPYMNERIKNRSVAVLHTNDTRGNVEPLPGSADLYAGMGGMSRRTSLIRETRKKSDVSILVDAGNVAGNTAYVDLHGVGSIYDMMSFIGYDAATIGDIDLQKGIRPFLEAAKQADFPFVVSNYRITHGDLHRFVRRFTVVEIEAVRIGIFGLGSNLERCANPELSNYVEYRNPVLISEAMVRKLRYQEKCDLVVCLSRLGYQSSTPDRLDDVQLARKVGGIDLIAGGGSKKFMEEGKRIEGPDGGFTVVSQAGYGGAMLGHTRFEFEDSNLIQQIFSTNQYVKEEASGA